MRPHGIAAALAHLFVLAAASVAGSPEPAWSSCAADARGRDQDCKVGAAAVAVDTDAGAFSMIQRAQMKGGARTAHRPAADKCPPIEGDLNLDHFSAGNTCGCYDRSSRNQWAVVDAHFHMRPFGGTPVPAQEMMEWQRRAGILFTTVYGIGQRLPIDSNCTYYLDCPGTPVKPSMKNDFDDATMYLDMQEELSTTQGPVETLSMSFPDLHQPAELVSKAKLLRKEFPGLFKWAGELNVVKQALFNNSAGLPVNFREIEAWGPFMELLRENDIPVGFHSDMGNDAEPEKYLPIMDKILELYPNNKIIWLHLGGLSKQLTPLPPALITVPLYAERHAELVRERLKRHSNLMLDVAWDVLYYCCYEDPAKRAIYAKLLNEFPTRFIPGTDFVASGDKLEEDYRDQLNLTSFIFKDLSDEAFRNIALGQNYFDLLQSDFVAPAVCPTQQPQAAEIASWRGSAIRSASASAASVLAGAVLLGLAHRWS